MKRFVLTAVAAALAAVLCVPAGALQENAIALQPQATVTGDCITLADVAELGAGVPSALAELPLGNAPWPGSVRQMSRVLVKVRMVSAGVRLADFAFSGAEVCRVEVATVCVAGDEVACAARGLLDERLAGVTGELTLSLARPVPDQVLPAGAGEVELRPSLPPGRVTGRAVRVDVALLRDGLQLRRVPVSFSVARVGPVAVARTDIPAGRRLGPGSARLVQREVTSVSDLPITDLAELAGMVTARPLRAGQAIPGSALRPAEAPLVVERNRRVFIVVNTPTLRAVTMGKALADARLGEAASAENLASGRRVFGTAVDTDTIEVTLAGSGPHE